VSGPSTESLRPAIEAFVLVSVRLYRDGIADALQQDRRFRVTGSAASLESAEEQLGALRRPPDVALVDVGVPDGTHTVRALRRAWPQTSIVALAVREVDEDVVAWVEAGVSGLVSRDATLTELLDAVEAAAHDEVLTTPSVTAVLVRRLAQLAGERTYGGGGGAVLTRREREIIRLIDEGLSNKEIANSLRIELATVKNHVHHILVKLGVQRRAEAAAVMRGASVGRATDSI
jgi:two-component system, NarL family, nitrate/nitrite response regulator NarL